jgi:far upstream element-binding protein
MQGQPPPQQQQPPQGYPGGYPAPTPSATPSYHIPPPSNSGSLDLSNIKPVNSGSVSFNDAVAKARGIAAERGVSYDMGRANGSKMVPSDSKLYNYLSMLYLNDADGCCLVAPNRDGDPRLAGRTYRRSRSRSRSPPRVARDSFRDNYNPYRDERRDDPRRTNISGYPLRDRSFSPGMRTGRGPGTNFSPPPGRGFGGPSERSPPGHRSADDNVETIVIDSGLVGLIIGRQGENLRRVEAETATRVQFITGPEASGPMRQCKITGTRAAREDAKAEIYRIIEENGKMLSNKAAVPDRFAAGASKGVSAHQPALRAGEDATQIMVPNRTVGLIIGRGGETIRDLQERSQCHVNIVGEEKSVNGLRPVNLIGTPQAATMAKDLIMEIVESDTKSLANQGGGPRETGRGPPGFGGFGGGESFGGDKVNDTIVVPSEAVGMIIGKGMYSLQQSGSDSSAHRICVGGETIKDMQSTTGCKINVAPASGQDFEREIGLVGTRGAIDQAKRAITDKVHAVVSQAVIRLEVCTDI